LHIRGKQLEAEKSDKYHYKTGYYESE